MKVTYDIDIDEEINKSTRGCLSNPSTLELVKFMESNHKRACLEFSGVKEASKSYNTISVYIKRHKLDVLVSRRKNKLFFIKAA
jgi:hypothetical protein